MTGFKPHTSGIRNVRSTNSAINHCQGVQNLEYCIFLSILLQEDIEPIRLSRFKFERFVHLPFFKKLIAGCFVRLGNKSNQVDVGIALLNAKEYHTFF